MNKKVAFMIIGAQKCGTSSIARAVSRHPQVGFSHDKEVHFFSTEQHWKERLDAYHNLFPVNRALLWGEASTTYSFFDKYPDTPLRLKAYNPHLKFIFMVRDPVERIISHYTHRYLRGRTQQGIDEEIWRDPVYINRSRYYRQLAPYLAAFGQEQVLLLSLEEYVHNTRKVMDAIAHFLEIDPFPEEMMTAVHDNRTTAAPVTRPSWLIAKNRWYIRRVPVFLKRFIKVQWFSNTVREKPVLSAANRQKIHAVLQEDKASLEEVFRKNFY